MCERSQLTILIRSSRVQTDINANARKPNELVLFKVEKRSTNLWALQKIKLI